MGYPYPSYYPFHFKPKQHTSTVAYVAHYINQSYLTFLERKIVLPTDLSPTNFRNLLTKKQFHAQHNDEVNLEVMSKYNEKNKELIKQYFVTANQELRSEAEILGEVVDRFASRL